MRKSFPLRINPKLYQALEEWAAEEMRSVNGQIEFLLQQAVLRRGRLSADDLEPRSDDEGPHAEPAENGAKETQRKET